MMEASQDPTAIAAADLLDRYGFDVGAFSAQQLVGYWLRSYPAIWVRAAVVEALYQGRYKSVSVGQILAIWKRRGQPIYHFNFEFERMICGNISRISTQELLSDFSAADTTGTPAESGVSEEPSVVSEIVANESQHSELPEPIELPLSEGVSPQRELEAISLGALEQNADSSIPATDDSSSGLELLTRENSWGKNQEGVQHPIHQFVPDPEISMFYEKLRAVAQDQQN
ncbi:MULTISPECIES: hypothetical protein [unclassified Leptolyngbya]|uniref:hypothetical protein n=1 Tax=unclassified Leptolyngbya TaxID=2650499 RepID=UPI001682C152|nr:MULTISPECIES: hypothetical protein [unclassified Leptolyngbya]MBD1910378.1 hypothetical protein [Leptolyngbya sp. FACHB-8]MBD2155306.1 hypothetical protein [Leptolyngbya sp. FACHB-16]